MNKVFLVGNVGKDPVVKTLPSNKKVATFSIATTSYKGSGESRVEETQWHNIVFWEKQAEIIEKYVKKGSQLAVVGEIRYRTYDTPDGDTKYITEILGRELSLIGKKAEPAQAPTAISDQALIPGTNKVQQGAMSDPASLGNFSEDNLPF